MKRLLSTAILLTSLATMASGLRIGGRFDLSTLSFKHDRVQTTTAFPGNQVMWGISASVQQDLSDTFSFSSGFHRDLILRNISYNIIEFTQSFLRIGVGPIFGFFNDTASILKAGISTAVQLEFPGIAYLTFRADSSIGGRLVEIGDYTQERSDIAAAVYVKNAIISAEIRSRKYSQKTAADLETVDGITSYSFVTDIYRKNVPYRVGLTFGYQNITRSYISSAATVRHVLNSIVLGTKVELAVTQFLTTSIDLESSIYTFGSEALLGVSNPGPGGYLFRVYAGFTFDTERLPAKE